MHYLRNWPEGLFILLVMAGPLALSYTAGTLLGFLFRLGLGIVVGLLIWICIIVAVSVLFDRANK